MQDDSTNRPSGQAESSSDEAAVAKSTPVATPEDASAPRPEIRLHVEPASHAPATESSPAESSLPEQAAAEAPESQPAPPAPSSQEEPRVSLEVAGATPSTEPESPAARVEISIAPIAEGPSAETAAGESESATGSSPASSSEQSPAAESGASTPAASPAADTAAADTAADDKGADESGADESGERPSERIKIGSQRKDDAPIQSVASLGPSKQPQKPKTSEPVPVPSLRSALEDDVEAEVLAALGGADSQTLQAAASSAPRELESGSKVQGSVASVLKDTVLFDLGGGAQGQVALAKFKERPETGAQHEVVVQGRSGDEGLYELSLPGSSVDVADWSQLQEGMVVEARITGANTGGLEGNVGGIRAFIPASQVALYRVDNLSEMINQRFDCVVLEAKKSKRNLVLSRRAILEREREKERKEKLEQIKPGDVVEGVVRNLREFGAFVDIGGVEGLVHIRQLSWDRIKHPKEVLEEGQTIKVKVEKVNQQTGKISLLFRDLSENPWSRVTERYPVNGQIRGTVSKIAEFGAFVKLEPGVEGLIHISELAHARVHRVSDVVKEGQEVDVKILSVDVDSQRIGLSLKALLAAPEPQKKPEPEPEPEKPARKRKSNKPLKGGIGGDSGGDRFGLRW